MRFTFGRSLGCGALGLLVAACSSSAPVDQFSISGGTGGGGAGGASPVTAVVGGGGATAMAGGGATAMAGGGSGGTAAVTAGTGGGGASAMGGGTGGASDMGGHNGCTPGTLSDSGTLMGPFGAKKVMAGGVEYYLQVNEWNSRNAMGGQTMSYGGDSFFKMTTQDGKVATNGGPTGFPSLFIGANSKNTTANSNLPKLVSSLTSVPTTWNWNDAGTLADATANSYNATYDVWFSKNATGEPAAAAPSGSFLMVWLHKPMDAQPIGKVLYPAVTIPGVSGTWDVWIGVNEGAKVPCTSYVRTQDTLALSYDLNEFIKDAVSNRTSTGMPGGDPVLQNTWYLTNIFSGFEIWRGGVNLQTTSFCAVVN